MSTPLTVTYEYESDDDRLARRRARRAPAVIADALPSA